LSFGKRAFLWGCNLWWQYWQNRSPWGRFWNLDCQYRVTSSTCRETRLLSGHGPETTVGAERKFNPLLVD
jgi:hypothetical protein